VEDRCESFQGIWVSNFNGNGEHRTFIPGEPSGYLRDETGTWNRGQDVEIFRLAVTYRVIQSSLGDLHIAATFVVLWICGCVDRDVV